MSVGIGIIGREVTFTLGGTALVGVNSKGFTFNNEPLDTTDDDSSGWQERLAKAGVKNLEFTVSGVVKNLELVNAWFSDSQIFPVTVSYPDGSSLAFDVFLDNIGTTGESNALQTFDATFSSSGEITFTPGV